MGIIKVREYKIPSFGEKGNFFEIINVPKEDIGIEKGYYGLQGISIVTEKCETLEEVERALEKAIIRITIEEIDESSKKINKFTQTASEIFSKGISQYIYL